MEKNIHEINLTLHQHHTSLFMKLRNKTVRPATPPPEYWLIKIFPTGCTCFNTQVGDTRLASEEPKHACECEQRA